jgi:hypothetical protein
LLDILFAYLELEYRLIRAVTPCYTVYDITPRNESMQRDLMKQDSEEAKTIQRHWRSKKTGWEVRADGKSMILPLTSVSRLMSLQLRK